jgi:hypothetical protein
MYCTVNICFLLQQSVTLYFATEYIHKAHLILTTERDYLSKGLKFTILYYMYGVFLEVGTEFLNMRVGKLHPLRD